MIKKFLSAAFVGMLLITANQVPVLADSLIRVQVTCYCEQGRTCTGSSKQDGIVASKEEWLGYVVVVYKVNPDGGIGDYIGTFPIDDIGYGRPVGLGTKSQFDDCESAGTIETGLTFDFRKPSILACKKFMRNTMTGGGTTGSEVYLKVVKGEG